jgi:hypothetical protein
MRPSGTSSSAQKASPNLNLFSKTAIFNSAFQSDEHQPWTL